jgi:hypothetical protein
MAPDVVGQPDPGTRAVCRRGTPLCRSVLHCSQGSASGMVMNHPLLDTGFVRGACPHDCARVGQSCSSRAGRPGAPGCRGFLCTKVNRYLEQSYLRGRLTVRGAWASKRRSGADPQSTWVGLPRGPWSRTKRVRAWRYPAASARAGIPRQAAPSNDTTSRGETDPGGGAVFYDDAVEVRLTRATTQRPARGGGYRRRVGRPPEAPPLTQRRRCASAPKTQRRVSPATTAQLWLTGSVRTVT